MTGSTDMTQLMSYKHSKKAIAEMMETVKVADEMCVCYSCRKLKPLHYETRGRKFCVECDNWLKGGHNEDS